MTVALTDPHGAALYNYYACGELRAEGSSVAYGNGGQSATVTAKTYTTWTVKLEMKM